MENTDAYLKAIDVSYTITEFLYLTALTRYFSFYKVLLHLNS